MPSKKSNTPPTTPDRPIKIDRKFLFAPIRKTERTTYINTLSDTVKKMTF